MPVLDNDTAARCCDAVEGSKYCVVNGDQNVQVIWKGGSAVNAYSLPDYFQIGHWNIEFPEGLDYEEKLAIVKENIDQHIEDENYPS